MTQRLPTRPKARHAQKLNDSRSPGARLELRPEDATSEFCGYCGSPECDHGGIGWRR